MQFRLENLLRASKSRRDERRAEVAQAVRAQQLLAERRQALQQELDDLHRQKTIARGSVNVEQLAETARYELTLGAQHKQLEEQSAEIAMGIQRLNDALLAAEQQVQMLEKLKSKDHDRQRTFEQRKEQMQSDQCALSRCQALAASPLVSAKAHCD